MPESPATIIEPPVHPLKALRKALKLSQFELAMRSKCSTNIIVFIERYHYQPSEEIQRRLAKFLAVDPKDLFPPE